MFINGVNDELILAARLLLATLFLIFGWRKLRDFSGTVSQMVQLGVPTPVLAAGVATFMELPVAFAVAVGALTRTSALLLFLYTLGTALIGHRYWTMTGADQVDSMDSFYKNLSIMGGLLLVRENIRSMNCAVSPHHSPGDRRRCNVTPGKGGKRLGSGVRSLTMSARNLSSWTMDFVSLAGSHSSLLKHTAQRILANREIPYLNWSRR
jgi:putative oxidoreductase